jgi:hypothetical protein
LRRREIAAPIISDTAGLPRYIRNGTGMAKNQKPGGTGEPAFLFNKFEIPHYPHSAVDNPKSGTKWFDRILSRSLIAPEPLT